MSSLGVQVWSAQTADVAPRDWPLLAQLLDPQEQARGRQFRFQADQQAYLLAHALRRLVLGEALGVAPQALTFATDANGLVQLAPPFGRDLSFSISRTRGAVALAVSGHAAVGVDMQTHDAAAAEPALLDAFIAWPTPTPTPAPAPALQPTPAAAADPATADAFYFYWTSLEAFWKAHGTGLSASNPKIRFQRNPMGLHEITGPDAEDQAMGCVVPVDAGSGRSMAVAMGYPQRAWRGARGRQAVQTDCGEQSLSLGCQRRHLRSRLATVVAG